MVLASMCCRWVTKFKHYAKAFDAKHGFTDANASPAGRGSKSTSRGVATDSRRQRILQDSPDSNPNKELACEHAQLRPGFRAKAMLVPEHVWIDVCKMFPEAKHFPAPGATWCIGELPRANTQPEAQPDAICTVCSRASEQSKLQQNMDRRVRSEQRAPPAMKFVLDRQPRGYPAKVHNSKVRIESQHRLTRRSSAKACISLVLCFCECCNAP